MQHERLATQLAVTHRLRQCERSEALPEELRQAVRIRRRSREPHEATRRRRMPVPEPALELEHAALTCPEERA